MGGRVIFGDARTALSGIPDKSVQCCVTSPPYWKQRDYGHPDQIGQEDTPAEYVAALVQVFREVHRVLRDDGTLWLNIGDSHVGARGGGQGKNSGFGTRAVARSGARVMNNTKRVDGLVHKSLVGIPWRVALALMEDGWVLRMDNIWEKPNPTPESMKDRCTKSHEYVFHFSKSRHYYYDKDAIAEEATGKPKGKPNGKNKYNADDDPRHEVKRNLDKIEARETRNARSVWRDTVWCIPTQGYDGAHFAAMPPKLAARCILAGSRFGDRVIDPFLGSGTVGEQCEELGRPWYGVELQGDYSPLISGRTQQLGLVPLHD